MKNLYFGIYIFQLVVLLVFCVIYLRKKKKTYTYFVFIGVFALLQIQFTSFIFDNTDVLNNYSIKNYIRFDLEMCFYTFVFWSLPFIIVLLFFGLFCWIFDVKYLN
jgi:hypothetical protein